MRRIRLLLDANVLVDAQVRDLFMTMAEAELIDLRWSGQILAEMTRALTERLGLDSDRVMRLVRAVDAAFPEAKVEGYEHLVDGLDLADPDDRHVLAAARKDECDFLVTYNDRDFPEEGANAGDVQVLTPDEAIFLLAGAFPDRIDSVIRAQIERLHRPAMTVEGFLERLAGRAPTGAAALGAALGVEDYERIFEDIILSQSPSSAQGAVQQLLRAIQSNDSAAVAELIDVEFAETLTEPERPVPELVLEALSIRLDDVFTTDGWGMATARRIHGPDVELVKLIRGGDQPVIAFEPQAAQGHLFYMKVGDNGWVLVGLDGPDPAVAQEPAGTQP